VDRLDKESNRAFYDSERQDDRKRFLLEPSKLHTAALLVPWIVSSLGSEDRLLDIAGGSGSYASQIVRAAPRVSIVGVDISESMIRQRGEDSQLAENVVGDMEALPFEDGSFDAAMFVAALHHFPDPGPALREAWRVLRPGGRLYVSEPCSLRAGRGAPRPVAGKPHEFAIWGHWLARQIQDAAFEIEEHRGHNLTIRAVARVIRSPSLSVYLAADRADRVLGVIPGLTRLGKIAMVRARKSDVLM
jgi:SAM-dependent methyltransferase